MTDAQRSVVALLIRLGVRTDALAAEDASVRSSRNPMAAPSAARDPTATAAARLYFGAAPPNVMGEREHAPATDDA